ncbi:AmmeMemoRadiSam system protein B [Candidatus Uhrbacteria bacterium]|nr:AmmeMemoRadiSam system protein B [Candidatus Uhrbacteria bacterium]
MLVFAAITPHTPLLIPTIGKENLKAMTSSVQALERLAEDFYLARPDTVIVLSSHATVYRHAFAINLHDEYLIDFKDFGDLRTFKTVKPDLLTITQIQRALRDARVPFTLDSDASLDYGTGVPLTFLLAHSSDVQLVPLSHSGCAPREHVRMGHTLKDVIDASPKRIAVIASGDLSHALTSASPLGFRPEGQAYDERVLEAVKNQSLSTLLHTPERVLTSAGQCLQEQLLILMGVLEKRNTRPEVLSYESPFGVGYLVAEFHLTDL